MKLTLHDVVHATQGKLIAGFPGTTWEGVSIDSRTLQSGSLFFALHGPRFDGHHFLKNACEKKARALVIDRLDPKIDLPEIASAEIVHVSNTLTALQALAKHIRTLAKKTVFIGLTGSNGKTTTKEMLTQILQRAGKTLATRGNLNNHIGLPLMLTELSPDDRFALLEMGTSMPGDMEVLVDLLRPQVALITNVGKDHLEFFGTPEGVLKENQKLFDALPKDGIAVINVDDVLLNPLAKSLRCKKITFGMTSSADLSAQNVRLHPGPLQFELHVGKDRVLVHLQTHGSIQVMNALAAAACAHALGISIEDIQHGLESFRPSAMRMETRVLANGACLVEDAYNANPSSMRASIESFCTSYPDRSRWLVLADMRELGPGARDEHRELGEWLASQPADRIFLYGRDARFIQEGLKTKSFKGTIERYRKKRYLVEALQKELIRSKPKPAVLFKASRRMKLEQVSHALSSLPS